MEEITPTEICDNATATAHMLIEIFNHFMDRDWDEDDKEVMYTMSSIILSNLALAILIESANIQLKLNLTMNGRLFIHKVQDEEDSFYG